MHVHANDPGAALSIGGGVGALSGIEIADMHGQIADRNVRIGAAPSAGPAASRRRCDVVAVVTGAAASAVRPRNATAAATDAAPVAASEIRAIRRRCPSRCRKTSAVTSRTAPTPALMSRVAETVSVMSWCATSGLCSCNAVDMPSRIAVRSSAVTAARPPITANDAYQAECATVTARGVASVGSSRNGVTVNSWPRGRCPVRDRSGGVRVAGRRHFGCLHASHRIHCTAGRSALRAFYQLILPTLEICRGRGNKLRNHPVEHLDRLE